MMTKWLRVPITGSGEPSLPYAPKYSENGLEYTSFLVGGFYIMRIKCEQSAMGEIILQQDVEELDSNQVVRLFKISNGRSITVDELESMFPL